METEEERKRGRKVKIKVKKSHHIGTEPLLYVIHDRGLRYRDLWIKAKPRGSTKATQQQRPDNKNKDCHTQTQSNITGAEGKIKIEGKKCRFAKSHTTLSNLQPSHVATRVLDVLHELPGCASISLFLRRQHGLTAAE